MTAYYFKNAFAVGGTKVSIPTEAAGDGSVSYANGWTPPYEADQATDPSALDIPRGQTNQLYYQITQALQQYQQYGAPDWITSADNGGTPFPYPIYASVYYGGLVYENQVAGNITTPGADATWKVTSGASAGVIAGMLQDWAGPVAPSGWMIADGSALSRTTYATLYANITQAQTGTRTSGSAIVTGLTSTTGMYTGMAIEGTGIPAATTILTVDNSTQITMSANASASGTSSIRFFYWGAGDGSTTFNIPNLVNKTLAGAGGSGYSFGDGLGQTGGAVSTTLTTAMLPNHTHVTPSNNGYIIGGGTGIGYGSSGNQFAQQPNTGGITGFTTVTPVPTIPPLTLVNIIIRLL